MKKILLSLCLFSAVMVGRSQTILNELYVQPSPSTNEFFELYYAGVLPIGDNVDCWTMVSYFDLTATGGGKGVYVMDLPNVATGFSNRYMVGAASNPFTAQGSTGKIPNFNWNAMPSSGRVTKWNIVAGAFVQDSDPVNLQDFFNNKGGGGFNYSAMIFVNGIFNNGFLGGSNSSTSSIITSLPTLSLTTLNSNVCTPFTINFATLGAMENVNSAAGTDNGYNRKSDGKCGAWEKSSSSSEHTPGITNGATSTTGVGSMTTTEVLLCSNVLPPPNYFSTITFDIVDAGTSGATIAEDFPVEVQLFFDNNKNGIPDGPDTYQRSKFQANFLSAADTFRIPQNQFTILIYRTKRGCFDKVVKIANPCVPLPVHFKSFTATRSNSTNVSVKWETASEQNSAGFAVERNVRGTWEQVAYIPSQAVGGTSNSVLTYQLNDLNATRGVSQYRIRQDDIDGAAKLSDIRSVRGEGQKGSTIVYPNPTDNGKVNIVFEGGEITKRNISVQDMSGRIVKQWNNYSNNNIQIENLSPGFYTVRIVDIGTGEQSVEKVVVNKR
jgi:hypothetical protein